MALSPGGHEGDGVLGNGADMWVWFWVGHMYLGKASQQQLAGKWKVIVAVVTVTTELWGLPMRHDPGRLACASKDKTADNR